MVTCYDACRGQHATSLCPCFCSPWPAAPARPPRAATTSPRRIPDLPPARAGGIRQTDWDAESVDDETRSTHLWIVNRAFNLLPRAAARSRPPSRCSARRLRPAWHQGLADADFKAPTTAALRRCRRRLDDAAVVLSGADLGRALGIPTAGSTTRARNRRPPTTRRRAPQQRATRQLSEESRGRVLRARTLAALLHRPHAADARVELHGQGLAAELHSDYESYGMSVQARFVRPRGRPDERRRLGAAPRRRARRPSRAGRSCAPPSRRLRRARLREILELLDRPHELLGGRRRRRRAARRRARRVATATASYLFAVDLR